MYVVLLFVPLYSICMLTFQQFFYNFYESYTIYVPTIIQIWSSYGTPTMFFFLVLLSSYYVILLIYSIILCYRAEITTYLHYTYTHIYHTYLSIIPI